MLLLNGELCDPSGCPISEQCQEKPAVQCTKYKQKLICIQESSICLEEVTVCVEENVVCLEAATTCQQWNEDDSTKCEVYGETCAAEVKICNRFENQCLTQTIQGCVEVSD